REPLTGGDQLTQAPLLTDGLGVSLHVRDRRRRVRQLREVRRAADLLQPLAVAQVASYADLIHWPARLLQLHHGIEDAAVGVGVEVVRLQGLLDAIERIWLQEDGAEHRGFCVQVVRWNAACLRPQLTRRVRLLSITPGSVRHHASPTTPCFRMATPRAQLSSV